MAENHECTRCHQSTPIGEMVNALLCTSCAFVLPHALASEDSKLRKSRGLTAMAATIVRLQTERADLLAACLASLSLGSCEACQDDEGYHESGCGCPCHERDARIRIQLVAAIAKARS